MPTYHVGTSADLTTRVNNAANGDIIIIDNPIDLTTNLTINSNPNKTVTIKSAPGGPYVIKRMPTSTGNLITISYNSTLNLLSVILDGNRTLIPDAQGPLIHNSGTFVMGADPEIGIGSTLRNNSVTADNLGGALYNYAPTPNNNNTISTATLNDGYILDNSSKRGGGISNSDGCRLYLNGVVISGNKSSSYGGGVRNAGIMEMTGGRIENNEAMEDGGGIAMNSGSTSNISLTIMGGIIQYNYASGINPGSDGSVRGYGGGIFVIGSSATTPVVNIGEDTLFKGNVAKMDGGAIAISYSALPRLNVGANVIFENNTARAAYRMVSTTDIALHAAHIRATQFSQKFQYGYNNFDIQYAETSAAQLRMNTVTFSTPHYTYPTQNVPESGYASDPFNPPSDCGYYDVEWYTNSSLDSQYLYDFTQSVDHNITLYGKEAFVPCFFNLTFDANGGDPEPSPQLIEENNFAEEPPYPIRNCDIFSGWYSTPTFEPNTLWTFTIPVTENVRLYAKWLPNACPQPVTVSFDTQGAGEIPPQTILAGNTITPVPNPERGCDQFLGWFIGGNSQNRFYFNIPVSIDTHLVARWKHFPCILGSRFPWYERARVLNAIALSVGMQESALASLLESESIKIQAAARLTDPSSGGAAGYYVNNPEIALIDLSQVNASVTRMLTSVHRLELSITQKNKRVVDFMKHTNITYCQRDCDCLPST